MKNLSHWFKKKSALLVRDHVIYADLPDGRNWFLGVRLVSFEAKDGKKEYMYSNVWTIDWNHLKEGEGVWSRNECERYIPIIDMDGVFIQYYQEAAFWLEKHPSRFELKKSDLTDGHGN